MSDEAFMKEALKEAEMALEKGEVPIGAVLVKEGKILGRGHNLKEEKRDPTAHAEILALQEGSRDLNSWRLTGTTLYVTVEPCPMCAGALIQARVKRLVFGVRDTKAGVCGSLYNLVQDDRFNHQLEVVEGILEQDCRRIMQDFFKGLRK
ncbi:MAG: tRNA adenosine(34) deaminase TadA [Candidatus Syntrophonatronum acetioxidans]|uniref:tRNA-specific adenosine deaminase n=1 Tax=Candidatus Syntrophonatronum acetioxidans TaxID=1795816 RepID=A0A424YB64_9FIRM|nr:MAG: tRNA adenosine(34) deaminase TadA [Candidatus Syntrophonatronum acetioxidans]